MVVSGRNNALDETIEGLMKSESGEFEKITYRNKSANWFVLSGFKGEKIVYIKGYVGNAAINQLTIEYPSQSKKDYDKTVTEVSRSFKPGDLLSGH